MAEKDAMISFDDHKRQIAEYQKLFPFYETYAKVLKEILEKACRTSFPNAFVQARPKAVSSFAEQAMN
jgi:hypothetical protein